MRRPSKLLLAAAVLLATAALGGELLLRLRPGLLPRSYRAGFPLNGIELYEPGILARTPIEGYPVPGPLRSFSGPPTADLVRDVGLVAAADNPDPQRFPRVELEIDPLGFPNPRRPERADLLLVGDSFAVAAGLERPPGLRRRLAEELGREVYDLGISAIGPGRQAWLLEQHGLPLQPRAVVWLFFGGNDLDDLVATRAQLATGATTFAELPDYRPPPRSRLLGLIGWLLEDRTEPETPAPTPLPGVTLTAGTDAGLPFWFSPRHLHLLLLDAAAWRAHPGWQPTLEALRGARDACEDAGASFLFVYLPTKAQAYLPLVADQAQRVFDMATFAIEQPPLSAEVFLERALTQRGALEHSLQEFCASEGIAFLSATPWLAADARSGKLGYLAADTHWSPVGQEALLQPLLGELAALGLTAE